VCAWKGEGGVWEQVRGSFLNGKGERRDDRTTHVAGVAGELGFVGRKERVRQG